MFFKWDQFKDLRMAYGLGIGVEKEQLANLFLDFMVLYLTSMYFLTFGNPILQRSVKKIFWSFPTGYDHPDKWKRLSPEVYKQVKWLWRPKDVNNIPGASDNLSEAELEIAKQQFEFAKKYNRLKYHHDLERMLVNYVDLNFINVWSSTFCKEKKWDLKNQSMYFRIVKKGSLFVYLTFHIFTIFIVLLMATLRQSIISVLYVLILLPHLKTAAEVLTQRLFA